MKTRKYYLTSRCHSCWSFFIAGLAAMALNMSVIMPCSADAERSMTQHGNWKVLCPGDGTTKACKAFSQEGKSTLAVQRFDNSGAIVLRLFTELSNPGIVKIIVNVDEKIRIELLPVFGFIWNENGEILIKGKEVNLLLDHFAHGNQVRFGLRVPILPSLLPITQFSLDGFSEALEMLQARDPEFASGSLALKMVGGLNKAVKRGDSSTVKKLLQAGANANSHDSLYQTPLHDAAANGHSEIADMLVAAGADVDATDILFGETPLHRASRQKSTAIIEVLIRRGAMVNARDKEGETPLHQAAEHGHKGIVRILVDNKADLCARNKNGRTPLGLAIDKGHTFFKRMLKC